MVKLIFKVAKPEQDAEFIFSLKRKSWQLKRKNRTLCILEYTLQITKKLKKAKRLPNNLEKCIKN